MPRVNVNGHDIHFTDLQPKPEKTSKNVETLTFIFIHGLGASENFFFPVLPPIADQHRCIVFDTYGSSRSPFTGDVITIDSIAADVLGILDALKVDKAVVVGHSMGGIVANQLAAKFPDRIRGVVGLGPSHPTPAFGVNMNKRIATVNECGFHFSRCSSAYGKLTRSANSGNGANCRFGSVSGNG